MLDRRERKKWSKSFNGGQEKSLTPYDILINICLHQFAAHLDTLDWLVGWLTHWGQWTLSTKKAEGDKIFTLVAMIIIPPVFQQQSKESDAMMGSFVH